MSATCGTSRRLSSSRRGGARPRTADGASDLRTVPSIRRFTRLSSRHRCGRSITVESAVTARNIQRRHAMPQPSSSPARSSPSVECRGGWVGPMLWPAGIAAPETETPLYLRYSSSSFRRRRVVNGENRRKASRGDGGRRTLCFDDKMDTRHRSTR